MPATHKRNDLPPAEPRPRAKDHGQNHARKASPAGNMEQQDPRSLCHHIGVRTEHGRHWTMRFVGGAFSSGWAKHPAQVAIDGNGCRSAQPDQGNRDKDLPLCSTEVGVLLDRPANLRTCGSIALIPAQAKRPRPLPRLTIALSPWHDLQRPWEPTLRLTENNSACFSQRSKARCDENTNL